MPVTLTVDGQVVEVADERATLLEVLRDQLGRHGVKDGCSPQGQCGCCTVLVDGAPRVACVTPVRRVADRTVTTIDGLDPEVAARWSEAFADAGASQCGFCSPGIILRLVAEAAAPTPNVERALLAHLCRCTGWRPIVDAFALAVHRGTPDSTPASPVPDSATAPPVSLAPGRDLVAAERRATLEGHVAQRVGPAVALGRGGFADDLAPPDALVAVSDGAGGWALGETLAEARRLAGKIQGRRTTLTPASPVAIPDGTWDRVLQTSWVDAAYVETDASWCAPGGEPASPLGNGGAFGAKTSSPVAAIARRLADETGRPVRVLYSREDAVRWGPKRPPLAAGIDLAAGRVVINVARTAGIVERLRLGLGSLEGFEVVVNELDVAGPPTSVALRGAGWAEGVALRAAIRGRLDPVTQPDGGTARSEVRPDGTIAVHVEAGSPLDAVVLRSYCIGAVHMAASWVSAEQLAVADDGTVDDLTVRSLGVLRAMDMPPVEVEIGPAEPGAAALAVSDAVFAATAAAVWAHHDWAPSWPTRRPLR